VAVLIRDRSLACMTFEPHESPYSFVAVVPLDVTERLLVEGLIRKGGNVEHETKFISAEQDDEGVNIRIEHRSQSIEVRAAVVVGCDGAGRY
jgi:2-polyprenyl-6-methoxyphenol hydroxylase-like FAD-dependent oxidoreductase